MDTTPLRRTIAESKTSTNATGGILLRTPDTTVRGGRSKNAKVTQWSCSRVVAFELQSRHFVCVPALDHMLIGQRSHCVLLTLAKVPALQLGQKNIMSNVIDAVPAVHLEQSCALDARGIRIS
jgi:hypothetical protein